MLEISVHSYWYHSTKRINIIYFWYAYYLFHLLSFFHISEMSFLIQLLQKCFQTYTNKEHNFIQKYGYNVRKLKKHFMYIFYENGIYHNKAHTE